MARMNSLALCGLVFLLAVGCGKSEPLPAPHSEGEGTVGPQTGESSTSKWPPATRAEAEEFASRLELAFAANDDAELRDLVDWESLVERATEGLGTEQKRKQMQTGLLNSLRGNNGFFANARRLGGDDVSFQFLRVTEGEDRLRVWFRLSADFGINYHDFEVVNQEGRIRAIDIHVLMTGESIAQTCRRSLLPLARELSKSWLEKLTSAESSYIQHYGTIEQMVSAMQRGNPQESLNAYQRLPESLKNDKNVLSLRYQAASQLEDYDEVMATAVAMQQAYPGDPCLDLVMIDTYFLRGEYEKALGCFDRIEQVVGTDPILAGMRGSVLIGAQRFDEAKILVEQGIEVAPDLIDNYWVMVTLGLTTKDHTLAYEYLNRIGSNFEVSWNDLREQPEYAEFVVSPEGKQWLSEHGF